ncbi:PilZ domain-containing protein [Geobacter pelophilus]|uniref:PilZ domain-containing protein n=1 Tax=Geoanaerobacter pelophilus TaxID=60036 RepID=A0AAW4KYL7_9BACT|nr:PilZ domain-containing protein [Geoanaerobacter pelophilus]MBT0663844.1 PilZ domain-containing protein [Geoanaerobacter pelophilus]
MAEKRYIKRHRRRFALRFGEQEATRLGFTEDISPEGMFIKTTNIYPPGMLIKVTLTLPDEKSISVMGKVMWAKRVPPQMARLVKKAGFGIKIEKFIDGEELYRQVCEKSLTPA